MRFALANPALFRLIFANPARTHARPEPKEQPPGALALLRANAAALAPPGTNAEVFALQSWAIAHGLAMLMLDGQVPVEQPTIDAVIDVSGVSAGKR